jgi:hypothetical protein
VFSLDNLKKYNGSQAGHQGHIYWNNSFGPCFGDDKTLQIFPSPMNRRNYGSSETNQKSLTVPADREGRSELTGKVDKFTCAEIEVFLVAQL